MTLAVAKYFLTQKALIEKAYYIKIKNFLFIKGQHKKSERATHSVGEDI